MKLADSVRLFASTLFHRSQVESEMDEELRAHIQNRADDLERSGLPCAEAQRRARIEFGGYQRFKEECREAVGAHFFEGVLRDIRFGLRALRKSPGFTAVAVFTLALGIGANTAIFSLIDSVLLRPLPYAHPKQLVQIFENNLQLGVKGNGCSYPDMEELRRGGVFASVAGLQRHDLTLTGAGEPAEVATVVVTPEIFSLLNVPPLAGRYLLSEDETKGSAPVAVVSEGLWRTRFGGNPTFIGSPIMLDQRPFTVAGIMPAGFQVPIFGGHQEIWIPIVQDPVFGSWIPKRGGHWLRVVGRLKAGVPFARAQSQADTAGSRLAQEFPAENGGWSVGLAPLQEAIVANVKTPLLVLMGAVGLVLLLACVNIANLLLARATSRVREIALRQALGAKQGRIIRQLLTETAMLGLLGAILGLALAAGTAKALVLLLPQSLRIIDKANLDLWVLAFALLLSLAATIAFGLAPALLAVRSNVQSNLKDSAAQSGSGGGRVRLRRFLAAAEIALATVLVVGAGLLARSLLTMTSVNPGFNVARILRAEVSLPQYRYSTSQQWAAFSSDLLNRIHAQPGLQAAASAAPLPVADGFINLKFSIAGYAALPRELPGSADYVSASSEYFRVMGIPLLQGRLFARDDSETSPRVAIISQSFARLYFRNENPIGQRLVFGFPPDGDVAREIVGVVGDVRDVTLTQDPGPMMYVPWPQAPFWGANLVVKTSLPPSAVVGTIRKIVRSLDKDLPITDIATMPEILSDSVAQPKFRAWLVSAFGIVALLLAAIGVFGVVSYSVASRTREFGVRAALGASPSSIGRMILREGLSLGAVGLGAGLVAAAGFARFLKTQLYGVTVHDPASFFLSATVLLAVAALACYFPARRAMRVDPMAALRCE